MSLIPNRATRSAIHRVVGQVLVLDQRARSLHRGLSQSTENAILLTGAVALAIAVVGLVTSFVTGKLGSLG